MAENPTTGELYKAKAIHEVEVVAAVDAFMPDPTTTAFLFGDDYQIDLVEAVSGHEWAKVTVANKDTTDHPRSSPCTPQSCLHDPRRLMPPSNSDAHQFAAQAHAGQVDKGGKPYIRHVNRVAGTANDRAIHAFEVDGLKINPDHVL